MSDLIDRQAAIDAINHICPVDTEYDCTLLDRVDVRYVLSALPSAQPAQRWIPVSERLPEVDELVLVTDDSGGVKTVDVDRCGEYEASSERFWYYTQNVIAWMPLPKPYKKEGD